MSSGTEAADSKETKVEAAPGKDVVLIAIDGSAQAEEAFDWYHSHLHRPGNVVILVHSLEISGGMPTRESWEKQMSSGNKKRNELKDKYTKKFSDCGIAGKFISDNEKPGEFVVQTARKENVTYIVMGTRGLGSLRRTVMGSVSDFVVHHSPCPVVVCRQTPLPAQK